MIPLAQSNQGGVANCLTLDPSDGVSCIACNSHYHLDSPSSCGLCIDSWCHACSQSNTLNACTQCIAGFYMPLGPSGGCYSCPMSNCDVCISSQCITCNSGYVPAVGGGSCNTCLYFMPSCLSCTSSTVCVSCNTGYAVDSSNNCSQCTTLIPGCSSCVSASVCTACNTDGYFLPSNDTVCYTCSQKISDCAVCDYSGINCTTCNANFMLSKLSSG